MQMPKNNAFQLESCLYKARVMHHRLLPKKHAFWYNLYFFYVDVDQIDALSQKISILSRNKFNLFNFRDKDHLQLKNKLPDSSTVKQQIVQFLSDRGLNIGNGKMMLLTHLAVLGYNFNPVSFYFCFDENDEPLAAVAEISNTYREMKLFYFDKSKLESSAFSGIAQKFFYVSPFTNLTSSFDFNLKVPGEELQINIDMRNEKGEKFFLSTLSGKRQSLSQLNLLRYFFKMPLIPLQVMALIHWQAFKLWIKGIPYHPKAANQDLQKDVYKPYSRK